MSLYLQRILSRPYHSTNPIKSFKLPFSFIPHTLIDNHTHILRHVHHTCVHNNCNDDIVHNMSCLCHLKVTGRAWAGHGAVCSSADGSQVTRVVARPRSCVANMSIVSPTQPSGYLPLVGTIQTLKHTLRSNPATSGHAPGRPPTVHVHVSPALLLVWGEILAAESRDVTFALAVSRYDPTSLRSFICVNCSSHPIYCVYMVVCIGE